jgi:hypothetical protein
MTKVPIFYNGLVSKRAKKMTLYSSQPSLAVSITNTNTNINATASASTATTLTVTTPNSFNTILSSNIAATISTPSVSVTSIVNRNRYMIKTNNTYINISDTYSVSFGTTLTTYKNFLTKVFQLVQDSTDLLSYRIDSELHSLYSLDYSSTSGKLLFTNNWGNGGSSSGSFPSTNGYLCFTYTAGKKLQVIKRYSYDTSAGEDKYTHTLDTSFAYANYYVKYTTGGLTLVSAEGSGSIFTILNSKMDVSIPANFNPIPTSYVSNPSVSIKDYVSNTITNMQGNTPGDPNCKFVVNFYSGSSPIQSVAGYYYAYQIKNAGFDTSTNGTNSYANSMLTTISNNVASNTLYKTLRYPTSVYQTFRQGALQRTLKGNCVANGDIGMYTTPYVYFTCEQDDDGQYHPFMCMASYSIADKPTRLLDVCKPPGDGGGSYPDQSVTRQATLQLYLHKIPMLDYGVVNDISGSINYGESSTYYKLGEATTTGIYYGSKTIFTKVTTGGNDYLAVISDGDPYPAKAGVNNFTNNLSVERAWPDVPNPLTEQDFEYKFRYRGGTNTQSKTAFFTTFGIQGIFLNGVALYNPSSGSGTVPGTTISGNNTYNLNAVFFEKQYGIDAGGGHPSPEGNIINDQQGQYHYHDPMFLTSGSWNNTTFASSNVYFSSDYYTDDYGEVDYIRHAVHGHSKIVGFCFDGYPIYGPYGYSNATNSSSSVILMTTSYRPLTTEFTGRPYTYNQIVEGSSYSYKMSAGAFLDDYEYVSGLGSLDDCNGRYCVTPEYPSGTYAYFVLIDENDDPVFPYIIGKFSKQARTVTNAGYPNDTHNSGGSTTPTTGTAGVFDVSTLGVSRYVSSTTEILAYNNINNNDMHNATLADDFIINPTENGNWSNSTDERIIRSISYNNYNYTSIAGIGVIIDGVSLYPVLNNTLTTAQKSAEVTNIGIHVGQGMGLHYHADGYGAKYNSSTGVTNTTNNLCLYNDADYTTNTKHPPLIGFGMDGIALYGIYRSNYSTMDGYSVPLDSFGGHIHGSYGYHYHAHTVNCTPSNNIDTITDGNPNDEPTYNVSVLMKGSWKGYINDIPEFWDSDHGSHHQYAPEYSLSQKSKYVWGYTRG